MELFSFLMRSSSFGLFSFYAVQSMKWVISIYENVFQNCQFLSYGWLLHQKIRNGDVPDSTWQDIWSDFMRNDIGKKLCHFFMCALLTCVRPIKVQILNRFLHVADHGLLTIFIKKKLRKINIRVRFYCLKLRGVLVFENNNNLGS